ncbi:type IV secretion system protein [Microvirga sp. VF16]|uniref:type IV secretion system protein n=1 Tax=Microvirga sp. VF16 TaxID=2807101 RepID=UPI00193E9EFA|nr:type IV secretion system protein [Microvirga sp. VF16]QRM32750.1 type IV secretion system protein [Microvirga sp. VF16]
MNDIIGELFNKVDTFGATAIQAIYTQLAGQLQPVFLTAMAIYVAFWGYEMLIGRVGVSAPVFLWRIGRMMLIYTLAFSWADFQTLIVEVLSKAPEGFGRVVCQAVGGGGTCTTGISGISNSLTEVWTATNEVAQKISAAGGTWGLAMAGLSYLVLIVCGLFVAAAIFLVVLGKIALFVLLGLAPIFIAFALFQITVPYFDGWMKSCAQYAIIPLIVYGILGFYIVLLRTTLDDMANAITDLSTALTVVAPFMLMCVVGYFLIYQSLAIAQGIAGGARLSAEGRDRAAVKAPFKAGQWAYNKLMGKSEGGSNSVAPSGPNTPQASVAPGPSQQHQERFVSALKSTRS